jgi:hypothetical protein
MPAAPQLASDGNSWLGSRVDCCRRTAGFDVAVALPECEVGSLAFEFSRKSNCVVWSSNTSELNTQQNTLGYTVEICEVVGEKIKTSRSLEFFKSITTQRLARRLIKF